MLALIWQSLVYLSLNFSCSAAPHSPETINRLVKRTQIDVESDCIQGRYGYVLVGDSYSLRTRVQYDTAPIVLNSDTNPTWTLTQRSATVALYLDGHTPNDTPVDMNAVLDAMQRIEAECIQAHATAVDHRLRGPGGRAHITMDNGWRFYLSIYTEPVCSTSESSEGANSSSDNPEGGGLEVISGYCSSTSGDPGG